MPTPGVRGIRLRLRWAGDAVVQAGTDPPSGPWQASGESMRIGVFGGTFDPIHVGHLVAAVNARHTLGLDRVLFVVANEPWQKVGDRPVSPALDRLTLVDAALGGVDGLEASRLEIDRGGPSYTVDTIEELRRLEPTADLYLIVGADVIAGLTTWERLDDVRRETTMVVVNRPGSTPVLPGQRRSARRVERRRD